jgi:hypothetical protein
MLRCCLQLLAPAALAVPAPEGDVLMAMQLVNYADPTAELLEVSGVMSSNYVALVCDRV